MSTRTDKKLREKEKKLDKIIGDDWRLKSALDIAEVWASNYGRIGGIIETVLQFRDDVKEAYQNEMEQLGCDPTTLDLMVTASGSRSEVDITKKRLLECVILTYQKDTPGGANTYMNIVSAVAEEVKTEIASRTPHSIPHSETSEEFDDLVYKKSIETFRKRRDCKDILPILALAELRYADKLYGSELTKAEEMIDRVYQRQMRLLGFDSGNADWLNLEEVGYDIRKIKRENVLDVLKDARVRLRTYV